MYTLLSRTLPTRKDCEAWSRPAPPSGSQKAYRPPKVSKSESKMPGKGRDATITGEDAPKLFDPSDISLEAEDSPDGCVCGELAPMPLLGTASTAVMVLVSLHSHANLS